MLAKLSTDARERARLDLAAAAEATRRSLLAREFSRGGPFLFIWGVLICVGVGGAYRLLVSGRGDWIETWWFTTTGLGLLATGFLERRLQLRSGRVGHLWGMMALLAVQGWLLLRILPPLDPEQGVIYPTALILSGWVGAALIFRQRILLAVSLLLMVLAYFGYILAGSTAGIYLWLGGVVGGGMLLAAGAAWLLANRLHTRPSPCADGEDGELG